MPECGAKTRNGSPCKNNAMSNGRCRMHGGKSTGVKGNKNAAKPGSLYSKFLTEDEQKISEGMNLGSIDEELRLTRIRLMRALERENKIDEESDPDSALECDSKTVEPVLLGGMPDPDEAPIVKRTFRRRDYVNIVDRLTARIASLEMQRATLMHMNIEKQRKQLELDEAVRVKGEENDVIQNVIVVPGCADVDAWEQHAAIQQETLLNDEN